MTALDLGHDLHLHYDVAGRDGPALLLFNGARLPLTFWGSLARDLARDCRVIRLDARDAGKTRFEGTFSLTEIAGDAARLLDHLGIERACIVGHARGGRAAQVFARDYPHRVSGLVVCGTGGRFPAPGAAERLARLDGARRAGDRAALSAAIEEEYCAPGFAQRHPAVLAEIVDAIAEPPLARGRWDRRVAPTMSYWGQARVPSLLIYGQQDRDGTPENALDLQARLSANLVMFEDAGHFVVREKEVEVAALLKEFARSVA